MHTADREDRRATLIAASAAADATDSGVLIAEAIVESFRSQSALLPSTDRLDRIGLAGRTIARRRANAAILDGFSTEQMTALDNLLTLDPTIDQTRFGCCAILPKLRAATICLLSSNGCHAGSAKETAQTLRLFRDTLRALAMANETDTDMFDALNAQSAGIG